MSEADVLYVEDLAYRYGKTEVFAGASLSLRAGEVAFLTGPNGAGKSTLLRCLAGWDAPAEGRVELCGRRFDGADRAQRSLLWPSCPTSPRSTTTLQRASISASCGRRTV